MIRPFTFEEALYQLKLGKCVARSDWKDQWVFLFMTSEGAVQIAHKSGHGYSVPEIVWIKTVDDKAVPWACSQVDLLAVDWEIVERPVRQDQLVKHI